MDQLSESKNNIVWERRDGEWYSTNTETLFKISANGKISEADEFVAEVWVDGVKRLIYNHDYIEQNTVDCAKQYCQEYYNYI